MYLTPVCTPFGQRAENALTNGNGAGPVWIYDWSGTAYDSPALPPLDDTATPTLIAGVAVIVAVTLVRQCRRQGCAAAGVVIGTLGGAEVLSKLLLPRPDPVHAPVRLTDPSFPSGHVALPAGRALAAPLVASPRTRPYVTAVGTLWLAVTAAAVQAVYSHRPSDVLGAMLLACACHGLAVRLLPPAAVPGPTPGPRAAGRHPGTVGGRCARRRRTRRLRHAVAGLRGGGLPVCGPARVHGARPHGPRGRTW
ncbi:phosphatase PAP2 family protein [Streptomyces sp. NPDC059786]|uniref:phosphatase PAP2 family protein n=1 Tax=Streptomyces sp. NPDC059786 TaxID=3346946 RepID=UPI0036690147